MTAPTCRLCGRILVSRAIWNKYGPAKRQRMLRTHAPYKGRGLCRADYQATRDSGYSEDELRYRGDWVRRGLIKVPTIKRGPE